MSTPPPHDPNQWGAGANPPDDQNPQNNPPTWPSGPDQPQQPETGGWGNGDGGVTYNADKFDDSEPDGQASDSNATRYEQAYPGEEQPQGGYAPQSGGYDAQPQSGGYDAQPQSGGYPSQPQSGGYDAQPQSGGYPAQTGGYPQQPPTGGYPSQTGGYPTQPPPTGGYPSQTGGYPAQTGEYDAQPQTGGYDAQSGGYPAQTGGYPAQSADQPVAWGATATGGRKKSKKPLLIGGRVLVVVVAVVVGLLVFTGFDGIRNGKGEISNAKEFLDSTKKQWEEELPTDGIDVSDKAACYYILNDRDQITNEVACGPARRASSSDGAVWDVYHFKVSGSGDKQTASDPGSLKTGQKAPEKGSLVTAEGEEPADDGLDMKEPPLPRGEKNGVWVSDEYTVDDKSKASEVEVGDDTMLIGPGAQVVVDAITEYGTAEIDGTAYQAAEGQKFYAIDMTGDSGPITETTSNEVVVELNGETVDIGLDASSMGTTQILVSVPSDGESTLTLDSSGHKQRIDIATGERLEDESTSQYYGSTPEPETTIGQTINFPATSISQTEAFALDVTFDDAILQPYTELDGWAPNGQVWVTINFTHNGTTSAYGSSAYGQYSLDCMASKVDGGSMSYCASIGGGTGQLVASVPAGSKSISVNYAVTLTATGTGVPDASAGYGPNPFTVNFP